MLRKLRKPESVNRELLSDCYVKNMVEYLVTTEGITNKEASAFVSKIIGERLKLPTVKIVRTIRPGKKVVEKISFKKLLEYGKKLVMAPSGSFYKPTNIILSVVANVYKVGMATRSKAKKEMFAAIDRGDDNTAANKNAEQNNCKVKINSLPGGTGSAGFVLYDKGTYNATTSTARLLISNSFTCCEQLLGRYIPIFNECELINLAVLCNTRGPSDDLIADVMNTYKLNWVSQEQLISHLEESIRLYEPLFEVRNSIAMSYISKLSPEKMQFMFYHSNMHTIIQNNNEFFRPLLKNIFNRDVKIPDDIVPEDYHKGDEVIRSIATVMVANKLGDIKLTKIVTEAPEMARYIVALYRNIESNLSYMNKIMEVFIYHDINFQSVLSRKNMRRDVVAVSDTDSIIPSLAQWNKWYCGRTDKLTDDSYDICALMTYFLHEANADTMAKFIIGVGAVGEDVKNIAMKNEFLYPSFLLYQVKKVYAGIIKIQEGVVMKNPKPDIKGLILRGASSSPAAKRMNHDLLVNKILTPIMTGSIDAFDLINHVIKAEETIHDSLMDGDLEYLPLESVKLPEDYKNPMSSKYFYAAFWNKLFGDIHSELIPPGKFKLLKLITPPEHYWTWLYKENKVVHDRFKEFVEEHGKVPNAIFVESPDAVGIPPELRPIIDYRNITYFNLSPAYLTLDAANIPIKYDKHNLLLGDIYGKKEPVL